MNQQKIHYDVLGIQPDSVISKLFTASDLGISTTPYYLSDKSGSVAAMLEHALPVLCVSRKWIPSVALDFALLENKNIIKWDDQLSLNDIIIRSINHNNLSSITNQFLESLKE
ncbi:hypothetical protein [Pedobacter sp. SL55]|uniref:hypothetical protein n=1 Tax=Pedobacter sp. SL55 TaxID=2995161 RepID=UPI0022709404|nr:hypothetical protein [Pedobacter sp. SL55]WAC39053.1 hypothetical protein OVA16_10545 [Pedobacter sp. SL55]